MAVGPTCVAAPCDLAVEVGMGFDQRALAEERGSQSERIEAAEPALGGATAGPPSKMTATRSRGSRVGARAGR